MRIFIPATNYCATNPCQNGGVCKSYTSGYICTCPSAYVGVRCETGKCHVAVICDAVWLLILKITLPLCPSLPVSLSLGIFAAFLCPPLCSSCYFSLSLSLSFPSFIFVSFSLSFLPSLSLSYPSFISVSFLSVPICPRSSSRSFFLFLSRCLSSVHPFVHLSFSPHLYITYSPCSIIFCLALPSFHLYHSFCNLLQTSLSLSSICISFSLETPPPRIYSIQLITI